MKQIKPLLQWAALLLLMCTALRPAQAQAPQVLTFEEYIENVKNANINYLVEKYNVDIAEALVKAAKVFPDPELSVSYTNNQNWNLQMGYGIDAELSFTLELGGKRKARIRAARSEREMAEALLEDYFRNLQADAAIAYLTALKQQALLRIQQSSCRQMAALAQADSLRFLLGDITEVDARQSKLEAATMHNAMLAEEGALHETLVQLALMQGTITATLPDSVAGTLNYPRRHFDLPALVATAQENRADRQAALRSRELSQNNLRLAKANRMIDLGLNLGASYAAEVRNETAPAPAFTGLTAGIALPLKFSSANKGALRAAQLAVAQSEKQDEAIATQIASEVVQAYHRYETACRQVAQFNTGLRDDAALILQKKSYGYTRGETSILDVLNAQRTYNEVQTTFTETLYNCAVALIELQRACGAND
jgi:cobalt-zinc-cadmium efflux system outer membrane protein